LAIPALPPPQQALAATAGGVVWFDEGPVFFDELGSAQVRLGPIEAREGSRAPQVSASATAVAAMPDTGSEESTAFVVGMPPGPLVPLAGPTLLPGGGCRGWESSGNFVVADDQLVAAGRCHWDDRAVRQPLFVTSLRQQRSHGNSRIGGASHARRWRVLRWLAGEYPPILAAEKSLLAVGVQLSPTRMAVSIFDVRTGRTEARFELPAGYLRFASPTRLVLSVAQTLSSPESPDVGSQSGPFDLALYSTRGQRIADLGSSRGPPLVSHMHLVTDEYHEGAGSGEYQTLSLRNLTDGAAGAPKPVIGFNAPARALIALAFRWPALSAVETTSAPLQPNEIGCWSGDYSPAGKPFLQIFDLARNEAFRPAPAIVHVQPSQPLTNCGPVPP
jgi:hypothetical protein